MICCAERDTASFGGVSLSKTHNLILIMRTAGEKTQIGGVYTDPLNRTLPKCQGDERQGKSKELSEIRGKRRKNYC